MVQADEAAMTHPFRFIHVPKTAGSTIAYVFGVSAGHELGHILRAEGPEWWDRAYTFAFVRNPWAQAVSWYLYCRAQEYATFPDWLEAQYREERQSMGEDGLDQLAWVTDPETGRIIVNELHDFDSLEMAYVRICDRIGERPRLPLPCRNPLGDHVHRLPYVDYHTPETIALVAKLRAGLIDLMGYRFHGPDPVIVPAAIPVRPLAEMKDPMILATGHVLPPAPVPSSVMLRPVGDPLGG